MTTMFDLIQPSDLLRAVSGETAGIPWTIETEIERRPGYRLFVAGAHIATLPSPHLARDLKDEYIGLYRENETSADQALAGIEV